MILKPSACEGCPFYTKSRYFVPDTIVPNSKVLFLLQGPGEDEEQGHKLIKRHWVGRTHHDEFEQVQPQPLIGATGQLFNTKFLPLARLQREEVSIANAIRCRPGKALGLRTANDLPPIVSTMKLETSKADIVKALKHCRDAYLHVPHTVDTIVAMGRYAMFSLTGIQKEETEYERKEGIMESWRGFAVDVNDFQHFSTVDTSTYHPLNARRRIFFTVHIAALFQGRNKSLYGPTLLDFKKLHRMRTGDWPKPLPPWKREQPSTWPTYAAFDTEYIPVSYGRDELIRWSLCDSDYNVYCVEAGDTLDGRIPITPGSTILGQNWLADKQHADTLVDLNGVNIEDMMLAHTVLHTGEKHNLNYIQSKYGTLNKYKHLHQDDPQLYSAMDSYEPMKMWKGYFIPTFKADRLSWRYYKHYVLGLLNVYDKSQRTGSMTNGERLDRIKLILEERLESYRQRAREITGNPQFKLSGFKDMEDALYGSNILHE